MRLAHRISLASILFIVYFETVLGREHSRKVKSKKLFDNHYFRGFTLTYIFKTKSDTNYTCSIYLIFFAVLVSSLFLFVKITRACLIELRF